MSEKKSKNIVIIALCITLIFMGVGFAVLSQQLTIEGTATVTGSWDVHFSTFDDNTANMNAANNDTVNQGSSTTPVLLADQGHASTVATVSFNLTKPGDKVQYTATILNAGSIGAVLDSFTSTLNNDEYIQRTVQIRKTGTDEYSTLVNGESVPNLNLEQNETADLLVTYTYNSEQAYNEDTDGDGLIDTYRVTDTLALTFVQP